jgi:hypothetical protein
MHANRAILATLSAIKAANFSAAHSFAIGRSRESARQHAYVTACDHLPLPYDMPYEIVSDAIEAAYGPDANGVWIAA